MSVEPERNIEKELKAYAQQRRVAAGTPPELHPVTRKLLQGEVAKLGQGGAEQSRCERSSFWNSWLRMAVAGGAVAAVVAAGWVFFSKPPESQMESLQTPMSLAQNNVEREKIAEQKTPDADKPVLHAPQRALQDKTEAAPPPASTPAVPPPATVAAAAPGAPPPPAIPMTPRIVLAGKDASFSAAAKSPTALNRPMAAPASSVKADFDSSGANAGVFGAARVQPVIQRFYRTTLPETAAKSVAVVGSSNVLVSFRVEQARDKLRMIDSDGSVYTGFVERTPPESEGAAVYQKRVPTEGVDSIAVDRKPQPPEQRFRFRVVGTNRTLNEEVVFTGNILSSSPSATRGLVTTNAVVVGTAIETGGETPPLELRKVKLSGRLLLGGTNKIEILAVPAKP